MTTAFPLLWSADGSPAPPGHTSLGQEDCEATDRNVPDGCPISAYDQGSGPVTVIIAGAGLDDGKGYSRLAAQLTSTHRVLRLTRRQYRTDIATAGSIRVLHVMTIVQLRDDTEGRVYYRPKLASGKTLIDENAGPLTAAVRHPHIARLSSTRSGVTPRQ